MLLCLQTRVPNAFYTFIIFPVILSSKPFQSLYHLPKFSFFLSPMSNVSYYLSLSFYYQLIFSVILSSTSLQSFYHLPKFSFFLPPNVSFYLPPQLSMYFHLPSALVYGQTIFFCPMNFISARNCIIWILVFSFNRV